MLSILFGSKTAEKVLLFLFVNESSYPTEMKRHLHIALSPIQSMLTKLESGSIVTCEFDKNRKKYSLNPDYPLRWELESLLKKAYTVLSPEEKRNYSLLQKTSKEIRSQKRSLLNFWNRLIAVSELDMTHRARKKECSIIKKGKASIYVEMPSATTAIFHEKGAWYVEKRPETFFTNRFLWSLDLQKHVITLSHLRHGKEAPVFLFHLIATKEHLIESVDAHLCKDDTYLGSITWNKKRIDFQWRVIGPNKNDEMLYLYE